LRRAAEIKDKIQSLEGELSRILGPSHTVSMTAAKPKRKMSAAARARIAAGQKARWAKVKGSKSAMAPVQKSKLQISPTAKAKISAAAKARWAKVRAAKK
jgi:hypothetical protein